MGSQRVGHDWATFTFKSLSHVRLFANPIDCSLPGLSVHGILQARILEWVAISFSGDLPGPGIKPRSPVLRADSFCFFGKRILLCGLGRSLHSTNRKAFSHILVNLTNDIFLVLSTWLQYYPIEGNLPFICTLVQSEPPASPSGLPIQSSDTLKLKLFLLIMFTWLRCWADFPNLGKLVPLETFGGGAVVAGLWDPACAWQGGRHAALRALETLEGSPWHCGWRVLTTDWLLCSEVEIKK